ncbi:hypothetical protein [Antarcticirhabdus aurantiaca]|uniref:Uncharacterized protein n=1 Tax=Antarcticirhabdus aurantiaca TaxID=2606717 RepID=A0ACD4NJ45_9HYPH|nr:hypothetical protein OXU80_18570 [Jeongeuplla avenae]
MSDPETYTVLIEGFILGEFYEEGACVVLTGRQAETFRQEGRVKKGAPKAAKKLD